MKRSTKAALISALVFPGAGHFLLRRAARGCLFLLPAAIAVAYFSSNVMQRANAILALVESGALAPDPQSIAGQLSAAPGADSPMMTLAVVTLMLCWAGSIVDALLIGRQEQTEQ